MKNNNSNDSLPEEYMNNVWNEGKCVHEVTMESLKQLYEFWKNRPSAKEYRKDLTFEQFIDTCEFQGVVSRLSNTVTVVCDKGSRQCSCGAHNCRIHYAFHLEDKHCKDEDQSSNGKDKPKDNPPPDKPQVFATPSTPVGVG